MIRAGPHKPHFPQRYQSSALWQTGVGTSALRLRHLLLEIAVEASRGVRVNLFQETEGMRSSTLVLILALTCAGVASAQQTTGTVTGRAVDAQNLAVPGATVILTGPQ